MDIAHGRPVVRTSGRIKGTRCNGCCEVLVTMKRRVETERYWCDRWHGYVDPFNVKCPKDNM